ncbi:hypothetical protein D3C81_1160050 [compost metagenome]
MRLPRHAAHGDHSGAPGARVRPGPDHHRAERDLRARAQDRRNHHRRQPVEAARRLGRHRFPRADRHRHHPGTTGAPGQRHHPVHRETRRSARHAVPRQPGSGALRHADERSGPGLLRPSQIHQPRLCFAGLSFRSLPVGQPGQAGRTDQRRQGRCPGIDRAPRQRGLQRPCVDREDEGTDPAADVRCGDPGSYRRPDHRADNRQGAQKERTGQVLRW